MKGIEIGKIYATNTGPAKVIKKLSDNVFLVDVLKSKSTKSGHKEYWDKGFKYPRSMFGSKLNDKKPYYK